MGYEQGSTIYFRNTRDGWISFAWPLTVLEEQDGAILAAQLPGAVGRVTPGYYGAQGDGSDNPFSLVPFAWKSTRLVLVLVPDQWWTTYVFFEDAGKFMGWYVNFQRPFEVRGKYFDTQDLQLDLWVDPDRRWAWKDEDHYVSDSRITQSERDAVEGARRLVVAAVEAAEFPFDDSVSSRPPFGLNLPLLEPDWSRLDWL